MRVIVCGGREFSNIAFMWSKLDDLHSERHFTHFMQGGAPGADLLAKEWARTKAGLIRYECKAKWKELGKAAGPIRNRRMMEWLPDLVVGFPDPQSVGTWGYDQDRPRRWS